MADRLLQTLWHAHAHQLVHLLPGVEDRAQLHPGAAFVHDKVWYSECDVSGSCTPQRTDTTTPLLNLPMVALTDRNCASACDAFSDAVKDLKLVGARTAGIAGPGI